jgi:hypothetical protein
MWQVAVSIAILLVAATLVRTLIDVAAENRKVDLNRAAIVGVTLDRHVHAEQSGRDFYSRLLARTRELPTVLSAAVISQLPVGLQLRTTGVLIEGRPERGDGRPDFEVTSVVADRDAFGVFGLPLIAGRLFDAADESGPRVAVVEARRRQVLGWSACYR